MSVSLTYWMGTKSTGDTPSSPCMPSSLASNASGVPSSMVKVFGPLEELAPGASGLSCTLACALLTIWILST